MEKMEKTAQNFNNFGGTSANKVNFFALGWHKICQCEFCIVILQVEFTSYN